MNNPLVSVIIPVYNSEKYLAETINSVLNQSWQYFEILIVDDGSSDSSIQIAKSFEGENVRVFQQENKGASAARNKGLLAAKGSYVQFLDADDLLEPTKIEFQINKLINANNKIAVCPVIHFEGKYNSEASLKPSEYELKFYANRDNPFEFLLNLYGIEKNLGGMIPIHCWLTPIKLIKDAGYWNERLTVNDDGDYFCRVLLASSGVCFIDNTYTYYRKTSTGKSLSSQKNLAAFHSSFESILLIEERLRNYKNDLRINVVISRMLVELLYQCYPNYPDLAKSVENKIIGLGGTSYKPKIGGKLIEVIKSILGWKIARKLQNLKETKSI